MLNTLYGFPANHLWLFVEMKRPGKGFIDVQSMQQTAVSVHEGNDAVFPVTRKLDINDMTQRFTICGYNSFVQQVFNCV